MEEKGVQDDFKKFSVVHKKVIVEPVGVDYQVKDTSIEKGKS